MKNISAGFVVVWNNKVLLSHPTGAPWYRTYSIIKGGVEAGEKPFDAAVREFMEETGQHVPDDIYAH